MRWAWVLVVLLGACRAQDAALLSVTGEVTADWIDVYVASSAAGQPLLLHTGYEPVVDQNQTPVDISVTPLKLAVSLSQAASIKILLVGAIGTQPTGSAPAPEDQLFWAGVAEVSGTVRIDAKLLLVGDDDVDRDLWPSATTWPQNSAAAAAAYAATPELLDCDDDMDYPALNLVAADINPFARERCGDGIDEDCDGVISVCADADGDGDPAGTDCDDNNPAVHHPTKADPYPDPPNCCGYSLGIPLGAAGYDMSFLGQAICPTQRCGDGIDESCSGIDTVCIVDADCDHYPPCVSPGNPPGCDCDDTDPNTYPGAPEDCSATKDLNCSGIIGDGCVTCDLDGDGYQRMDPPNCPDATNVKPIDCDDYDSGVHPGQTSELGGAGHEGGGAPTQMVTSALRGNCRHFYDNAGTTPKIAAGSAAGDADCDGTAYSGCPSTACDADGDGFMNAGCSPPAGQVDCNDNDPTIFPNAPDKCGDGVISNCTAQDTACASITDADGDGYSVSNGDCNDADASIHPWAIELCDGKDNDCDGLVDEGNPTTAGAPMVTGTAVTACTTDNDGECGKKPGLCVCSRAATSAKYDAANRTACPTENPANTTKTPQCYFSGQPSQEKCNGLDDECVGAGFADGSEQCVIGTAPRCCLSAAGYACVDVGGGDVDNCAACGAACDPTVADTCLASMCECGSTGVSCSGTDLCTGGACVTPVAPGQPCMTNSQCASGLCAFTCCNATMDCSNGTQIISCDNNGDPQITVPCLGHFACDAAGDTCLTSCATAGDCAAGYLCNASRCIQCLTDADCGSSHYCNHNNNCAKQKNNNDNCGPADCAGNPGCLECKNGPKACPSSGHC